MKKTLVFIFLVFFLINCSSSEDDSDNANIVNNTPFSMGDFVSGAHPTSGTVSVSSSKTTLNFKNFKTDAGPKLLVYLTTSVGSTDYVSLGDLRGLDGDYSYAIPTNTDLVKYTIVDIWCVDFAVSFGHAELK